MFRTPIKLLPSDRCINLRQQGIAMGSCFADFMGTKMIGYKFKIEVNPFGILYHPLAVIRTLNMAFNEALPQKQSYLMRDGIYYNYNFHSSIAHDSLDQLKAIIEIKLKQLNKRLKQADYLMLTFGTAFQYRLKDGGFPVANCHKIPSAHFRRCATSADEILSAFTTCTPLVNIPRVIVSVSPIRHLKDGLQENSYSKSILRVVCQELVKEYSNFIYFPGYEIMLDDLRDYRFYKSDMIHPSDVAQEYIWEVFSDNYLDHDTVDFIHKWSKIKQNLNHRPFNAKSNEYRKFMEKTLNMMEELPEDIPCQNEKDQIIKQLNDQ